MGISQSLAAGQQAVQPGKPEEELLKQLFEWLKDRVGLGWTIIILT